MLCIGAVAAAQNLEALACSLNGVIEKCYVMPMDFVSRPRQ
jgi:hypothetical protein